jgi:hypothetical protein
MGQCLRLKRSPLFLRLKVRMTESAWNVNRDVDSRGGAEARREGREFHKVHSGMR